MRFGKLVAAGVLAATLMGNRVLANEGNWEYEFSSDSLASASIPRWQQSSKDGGASNLSPEGVRLESSLESAVFYQIGGNLWPGEDGDVTIEAEVAVEEVADGATYGAQLVVGHGAFIYTVNLPKSPMTRYRLAIKDNEASLYGKDGVLLGTTASSSASTPDWQGSLTRRPNSGPPKLFFGDGSGHIGGVSVWKMLRFTHGQAPEPEKLPKAGAKSDVKPLPMERLDFSIDPQTRYLQVRYRIPADAPDDVLASFAYRRNGDWIPAAVLPLMSPTGQWLAPASEKNAWKKGSVREQHAAGQTREITWMPYNQFAPGEPGTDFRIQIFDAHHNLIGETSGPLEFHNGDMETINNFSDAVEKAGVGYRVEPIKAADGPTRQAAVYSAGSEECSSSLEIAPKKEGKYAVFLGGDSLCWVKMGNRPFDRVPPRNASLTGEVFLGIHDFTGDKLKFLPRPDGTGTAGMRLSSVRFVPVVNSSPELSHDDAAPKILAGYFEPYSWAFWHLVTRPEDYRDAARVYREYGFDLVDTQFGRFGARLLYESKANPADRFFARETSGDPSGVKGIPSKSMKVWSMLEKTLPLRDMLNATKAEDLKLSANFGATNCYPGTPNESEFSKANPGLRRDNGTFLIFSEPKVRDYMLTIYREVLDLGAPCISLDFCRYPNGVDRAEDVTDFLQKLRTLADSYPDKRSILVRFPATGEFKAECFDYRAWAKGKLVDYLCPSNIKMAVLNFDVAPYVDAAKGTDCKVLPVIDLLPGPFDTTNTILRRAAEIYRAGADGIYVYQPDAYLFNTDSLRDVLPLLKAPAALTKMLSESQNLTKLASKNIFLHPFVVPYFKGYRASNDRIRFWLEGDIGPEAELWVGGHKLAAFSGYPYVVGDEAMDAPQLLTAGTHQIQIRAKDGDKWLERTFTVTVAANPQPKGT